MPRILLASVCVALTLLSWRASAQLPGIAPAQPQEFLRFTPPKDWEVANEAANPAQRVVQLVPQGQKIENWKELLTVHTYNLQSGKWPATVEGAMSGQQAAIAKRCPGVRWNVIARSGSSILYEWQISNCPPEADQHEIAKYMEGAANRFRVAYTAKVKEMSRERRAEWLRFIGQATIVKQ
jgi:hypothetical protein